MRGVPPVTGDLRAWAQALSRALQASMALESKTAASSAADDGVLVWDRSAKVPNVSRDGAFLPVGVKVAVPSTATSAGNPGDWAADSTHFYVCTAANTWRRVSIASW